MTDRVLVGRLQQAYWPVWLQHLTLTRVLRTAPCEYLDEQQRSACRGYDAGRVHFFVKQLRQRETLKPIEIDQQWGRFGSPLCPIVVDGNHRFLAHVLLHKRWISASLSGVVTTRVVTTHEWLRGKGRMPPFELLN